MTVIKIFIKLPIKIGKAVLSVTFISSVLLLALVYSIHLPIKGISVLSSIPQHTPGSLHETQESCPAIVCILLVPVGQEQVPKLFCFPLIGGEQESHSFEDIAFDGGSDAGGVVSASFSQI